MTRKQFKAKAEAAFMKANPTATITGWVREPRLVKCPTGVKTWFGDFYAIARGYRARVVGASGDETYVMTH